MQRLKITYILSSIDKAIAFEWIAANIDKTKIDLSFILFNQKEPYLYQWLKKNNIEVYYISHFGKKSYPKTFFKTLSFLLKIKPNIVHTHLFDANLIGLSAAKLIGIKKRIFTRHHATYHHDNFPQAIKYDKWANAMATHVVAISKNVRNILIEKESVSQNKISLIHHGFDLIQFQKVEQGEINKLKSKYNINDTDSPIVGVIARYIKWKGIQYIIPAFKRLLKNYPNAKLILANATGPDKLYIQSILKQELAKNQYLEIEFEANLFSLYRLFDVYVHVPIDKQIEAFGQTYVEALAAGVPSVFTLSGIANEFIKDKENALVVDYKNSDEIYNKLQLLLEDEELRNQLIGNGRKSIEQFNLNLFIQKLEKLYE